MFLLSIFVLAIITACLPWLVCYLPRLFPAIKLYPANSVAPLLAGILMVVSVYLPNIHISSETTTFQQHFVGGGMYSACLFIYAKQLFGWRWHWLLNLILLFAWVSAFGVANKLAEFSLVRLHLAIIDTADTDWDLLANTLGGFVGYLLLYWILQKKPASTK